ERRYLLGFLYPVQSWSQLFSLICTTAIAIIIARFGIIIIYGKMPALEPLILMGIVYSFFHTRLTLPDIITINLGPEGNDFWNEFVEKRLLIMGYKAKSRISPDLSIYRTLQPRIMRYVENEFRVQQEVSGNGRVLTITGPSISARKLYSLLLRELAQST
ncbi:MAG TPA: hypothetical protein PLK99_05085, partial [Burkholderiales bacterium]|nr:hypothetical protein [Burkholderiales bacterium]